MKDIRAIRGKYHLQRLIDEGEHEHQDFKFAISDARKIARSISAFANNDGGRLLVGVKDNGHIAGVRNDEDIYMIEQAAEMYCRPEVKVIITAIRASEGAVVLKAEIPAVKERPVCSQEPDGRWQAYYRVNDENIVAHPLMVEAWRRETASDGTLLALSDAETSLLRYISDNGYATAEDYMLYAHISRRQSEEIIIRLAAIGLLRFHYDGHRFVVVHSN